MALMAEDVASEVRAWMGRRQRSTRSAALELGWTETYLGRRLNGSIPFNVAELAVLAELLEVPVGKFFEIDRGLIFDKRSPVAGYGVAA